MFGGIGYYAGVGTYVALWVYIYSYFWEFTNEQISIIVIPMAVAALVLPPVMKRLSVGREKKATAIAGLLGAMAINVVPITFGKRPLHWENRTLAVAICSCRQAP